jgi:hypothetical protein
MMCNEMGGIEFTLDGKSRWQSTGPFLILHYYDRQHPRAQTVSAPSGDGYVFGTEGTPSLSASGKLSFEQIDQKYLRVIASFESISVTLTLKIAFRQDGAGFSILLEDESVREEHPALYRILGIELLPEFGAAKTGEQGYLTLPNWSGAQTFFDKSYPREVWQTIYSSNDQWENVCNMPVFGVTRAQGTLCGLVAQGDFDAQLVCRVHWESQQANSIHPYLVYRWQQQDERLTGPREVRYAFALADYEGGEGYVFCGKVYRDFLRAERGLLSWEEKARVRPAAIEYLDRFFLKVFMAYKDPQADGKGEYHITCTFDEVQAILEECLSRGMKKLTVALVGWGIDGHDGMPPTRFPVDERLGGETAFKRLIAWCRDSDILLGVHDSYGGAYTSSPEFNTDDLIRHRTGEYWESIIWSGGQCHALCPEVYIEKHVKRDIPAIRALGIYGHHHIDAVGSFMTCFSKNHPLERRADYVQRVREMFKFTVEQMGSVSTEMPFGPYFDVIDGVFHSYSQPFPWHQASAIGRYFLDRTIPLVSIALNGSVNSGASIDECGCKGLHGIDWRLSPRYEVCVRPSPNFGIPSYAAVADQLAESYHINYGENNLSPRLARLTIEGRWEIAADVHVTRYSDGTTVSVNLSSEPLEDLPSQSYKIENSR